MTRTRITFEGLMIFHQDESKFYELGILEVKGSDAYPDHELQISVSPEPHSHMGAWKLGALDLAPYVQAGNSWSLRVKNAAGQIETGITADESVPDRHDPNKFDMRFGWIPNMDKLHGGRQYRESGKMKPIFHFSRGKLSTHCKTGGLFSWQHGNQNSFGFMAGVLVLEIDTSAGQEVSLGVDGGGPEIFRLPAGYSYDLAITNMGNNMSNVNHFAAYYDYVFTRSKGDSVEFTPDLSVSSPNPCKDKMMTMMMRSENTPYGIPPYKCGGLLVDPGGDSLS